MGTEFSISLIIPGTHPVVLPYPRTSESFTGSPVFIPRIREGSGAVEKTHLLLIAKTR